MSRDGDRAGTVSARCHDAGLERIMRPERFQHRPGRRGGQVILLETSSLVVGEGEGNEGLDGTVVHDDLRDLGVSREDA